MWLKDPSVISRLLVQGILSVNSPYARIKLRGILVFALRGYLRGGFGPKTTHFLVALSLSKLQGQILSSLSLSWAQLTLPLLQSNPFNHLWVQSCCMLGALVDQVDFKPKLTQVSFLPILLEWSRHALCVCAHVP